MFYKKHCTNWHENKGFTSLVPLSTMTPLGLWEIPCKVIKECHKLLYSIALCSVRWCTQLLLGTAVIIAKLYGIWIWSGECRSRRGPWWKLCLMSHFWLNSWTFWPYFPSAFEIFPYPLSSNTDITCPKSSRSISIINRMCCTKSSFPDIFPCW